MCAGRTNVRIRGTRVCRGTERRMYVGTSIYAGVSNKVRVSGCIRTISHTVKIGLERTRKAISVVSSREASVILCRRGRLCTLSKITAGGGANSRTGNSDYDVFRLSSNVCRMYMSSNVNSNGRTRTRDALIISLLRGLLRTNFDERDTLGLVGSTVIVSTKRRSCSAISFTAVSVCANRLRLAGANTTPSFVGSKGRMDIVRGRSLPTKISI